MDKDLFQMKMFHVPTTFAEENKFAFVFMKVGELLQNGILTEVFIAPLPTGSLIRLIDSIVTQNREREILAVNYIKSTEIHMVQCNEDGRFRMVVERESALTDLIKNTDSEFSYQLITIEKMNEEENDAEQEEIEEEETNDTLLDDLDNEKEEESSTNTDNNTVRLDNGVKKNESQMNAPSLEQPNRVRLGNGRSEVRPSQPTQTETTNRTEQSNTNNRNEFKQRFGNPNRQNRFDNRNQNERPRNNNNNNERNENRNGKNQNQKNSKFRPKLAPTTFELVGD